MQCLLISLLTYANLGVDTSSYAQDFDFFNSWEEKYEHLIDLGKDLWHGCGFDHRKDEN